MIEEHDENNRFRLRILAMLPLAALGLSICLTGGYFIAKWLFGLFGTPSEIAAYIISGLLGFFIFVLIGFVTAAIQKHSPNGRSRSNYPLLLQNITQAITRISGGDFNILVPVDEHNPFGELAENVNKMARKLGSMEKLRQDFISDVSHEIQSPLTSISGFAALLCNEETPREEALHYAFIIKAESRRLSKLSENLLKLSTLEADLMSFESKPFRLDKQIENILLMLEPQWSEKNIVPELTLAKLTISGNEDLLSQVWINLLHNAIKFTPEGGAIRVTLTDETDTLRCVVLDNGIGIPKDDQIHIFERFYKADKSRDRALGGNGLGLSLVKKIAELHGGHVSVKSKEGKGTAFTVTLPNAPVI
ncbi:MAG: HAMP domain-containing histidine kinase [Oscillospiraceae bacterium]|jgi:signal transduction histidine kinase|nr:HAMP domain-containing histidine kinase [Oscillospiraceae bacterium]